MKALTLKHPWPWAICCLGKRIENRTWRPYPSQLKPGEWLAIHGGKWPTSRGELLDLHVEIGMVALGEARLSYSIGEVERCTGIVAVCQFGGTVTESDDGWFEGPIGWKLNDLIVLSKPVPCKGAQGLWKVPEDVLKLVRQEWIDSRAMAAEAKK